MPSAATQPSVQGSARAPAGRPDPQARTAKSGTTPTVAAPHRSEVEAPRDVAAAEPSVTTTAPSNDGDAPASLDAPTPSTPDLDEYVPRPLLTVPPVAQGLVIIGEPAGDNAGTGRYTGILSLFIDEQGQVQHVVGEEPLLPPAFEQAAREAFMGARFAPGRVDERVVKSRVRVEVVFDNTPLTKQ